MVLILFFRAFFLFGILGLTEHTLELSGYIVESVFVLLFICVYPIFILIGIICVIGYFFTVCDIISRIGVILIRSFGLLIFVNVEYFVILLISRNILRLMRNAVNTVKDSVNIYRIIRHAAFMLDCGSKREHRVAFVPQLCGLCRGTRHFSEYRISGLYNVFYFFHGCRRVLQILYRAIQLVSRWRGNCILRIEGS